MSEHETEYQAIHAQRMSLVRSSELWYQIGFPASLVVFAFIFSLGGEPRDVFLVSAAFVAASAVVWFSVLYPGLFFDQTIVQLYPRIVALELMLAFHFYRHYLSRLGERERHFVEACERIKEGGADDTELWRQVHHSPIP